MKVVVIGATGHVGTHLVPRLVEQGHRVVAVSRGTRDPYVPHPAWRDVERLRSDREAEEREGTFGRKIAALAPDVVIDMICFTAESCRHLVDALRGTVQHFLHTGTIWIHGPSVSVPTREEENIRPFGEYGLGKAAIREYLLREARLSGFPATLVHPGHIAGPGWIPLNPQGNFNAGVYSKLACGLPLPLPTLGMETVHHVAADDVAGLFLLAMAHRSVSVGEEFHAVSEAAVSLQGFAGTVASWFGREANLVLRAPDSEWTAGLSEIDVQKSWDHILRSPNASIGKARRLLDYHPRFTSLGILYEAVMWLADHGVIETEKGKHT